MMQPLVSLVAGVVFGLGLAVAEMTNPLKVLDFLDLAGNWDPSLAFVMGGAVLVTMVAFRFVLRRAVPLYGDRIHLPTLTQLDRKLLGEDAAVLHGSAFIDLVSAHPVERRFIQRFHAGRPDFGALDFAPVLLQRCHRIGGVAGSHRILESA